MARPKKVDKRNDIISVRLDAQTRFMLEFVSRLRGQTITSVVERAIMEEARRAANADVTKGWSGLWSVSEGERALNMARIPELYPTYEETRRLKFAEQHCPFFYTDSSMDRYQTPFVDILWPDIDDYVAVFEHSMGTNYWYTGKKMQRVLAAAGILPPDWPPQDAASDVNPRSYENPQLDDVEVELDRYLFDLQADKIHVDQDTPSEKS